MRNVSKNIRNQSATVLLVLGHYANLMSTNSRPGYEARLQTPYINTTGMCLELFYQSESSSNVDRPVIKVKVIDEEKEDTKVVSKRGLQRTVWDRMSARLPDGVHQVAVEGHRSSSGLSGMSIDDIVMRPCEYFGKLLPAITFIELSYCY